MGMSGELKEKFYQLRQSEQKKMIQQLGTKWSDPKYSSRPSRGDLLFVIDGDTFMSSTLEADSVEYAIKALSSATFISPQLYVVSSSELMKKLNEMHQPEISKGSLPYNN